MTVLTGYLNRNILFTSRRTTKYSITRSGITNTR